MITRFKRTSFIIPWKLLLLGLLVEVACMGSAYAVGGWMWAVVVGTLTAVALAILCMLGINGARALLHQH